MARNGKIVVTDSGKRGVRTTGKTAVFNTNGNCAECCGGGCEFCTGSTPDTLEVVFSDIDGCCKPGVFFYRLAIGTWLTAAYVNGTHELTQVNADSCVWRKSIVNVGYSTYIQTDTCDTFFQNLTSATVDITLTKTSASTWTLLVSFTTTAYGDYQLLGTIFYDEISGADSGCVGDLAFTNDTTDCSGICQDGTATVGLP